MQLKKMCKKNVIIIGAGLGGLVCGALLAKEGYQITLVEKNHKIGGGLQSYIRKGSVFDTGMHIFGGMHEGDNIRRICDYLGITDKFTVRDLDEQNDVDVYVNQDDKTYNLGLTRSRFVDSYACYFPEEKANLQHLKIAMEQIMDHFDLFYLRNSSECTIFFPQDSVLSVDSFVGKYISGFKLKSLLSILNLLYAGEKGITPALVHSALSIIFMNGACRVAGGYSTFADALARCITDAGGRIITNQKVVRVICKNRRIEKIITSDGMELEGNLFISSLPYTSFTGMLEGDVQFPKCYNEWLNSQTPSQSAFVINIKLKTGCFRYSQKIGFYLEDYDSVWETSDGTSFNRFVYMTLPTKNQGEYADTLNVILPMKWEPFSKWADTHVGHRGEEYLALKKMIFDGVLQKLSKIYPDIRQAIEYFDTFSPLTIRDYTGTINGGMRGIRKDCHDTLIFHPVSTRIPNLFFTGQNINFHGFCGVTLTALQTCEAIVGKDTIINKLNGL